LADEDLKVAQGNGLCRSRTGFIFEDHNALHIDSSSPFLPAQKRRRMSGSEKVARRLHNKNFLRSRVDSNDLPSVWKLRVAAACEGRVAVFMNDIHIRETLPAWNIRGTERGYGLHSSLEAYSRSCRRVAEGSNQAGRILTDRR
jgi:hypothetical protein